jgi:hypothetical protein
LSISSTKLGVCFIVAAFLSKYLYAYFVVLGCSTFQFLLGAFATLLGRCHDMIN